MLWVMAAAKTSCLPFQLFFQQQLLPHEEIFPSEVAVVVTVSQALATHRAAGKKNKIAMNCRPRGAAAREAEDGGAYIKYSASAPRARRRE